MDDDLDLINDAFTGGAKKDHNIAKFLTNNSNMDKSIYQ